MVSFTSTRNFAASSGVAAVVPPHPAHVPIAIASRTTTDERRVREPVTLLLPRCELVRLIQSRLCRQHDGMTLPAPHAKQHHASHDQAECEAHPEALRRVA